MKIYWWFLNSLLRQNLVSNSFNYFFRAGREFCLTVKKSEKVLSALKFYFIKNKTLFVMLGSSDPGTGVKVFSIAGRMSDVRQRCLGMTELDRQWRAQFLKDQILSHDEPRHVPEHYKATTNFFRRLWKTPMNNLEKTLQPLVGKENAYFIRHFIRFGSTFLAVAYIGTYFLKYHTNDWTKKLQWRYNKKAAIIYPDEPNYPYFHEKTPQEYADDGFLSSPYAIRIIQSQPQSRTLRYSKKQKGTEDKKREEEETICEK